MKKKPTYWWQEPPGNPQKAFVRAWREYEVARAWQRWRWRWAWRLAHPWIWIQRGLLLIARGEMRRKMEEVRAERHKGCYEEINELKQQVFDLQLALRRWRRG